MLQGVNLSGAEFGSKLPGTHNTDYAYMARWNGYHHHVWYAANGATVFRLPFKWERLQPESQGQLVGAELDNLIRTVRDYLSLGVSVILDPHNYAAYNGQQVTSDQLVDLWRKLVDRFAGDQRIFFNIMNEPANIDIAAWWQIAQDTVDAIRDKGARNLVLVPGAQWTGAHSWVSSGNAEHANLFLDPGNNCAFDVHQYLDGNSSGTSASAVRTTIGVERINAVTTWAVSNGHRLFLGEYGISKEKTNIIANGQMLDFMGKFPDVWIGHTAWGAGSWWAQDYYFRLDHAVSNQTAALTGFMYACPTKVTLVAPPNV